jgi:hypothetical protein
MQLGKMIQVENVVDVEDSSPAVIVVEDTVAPVEAEVKESVNA